MDDDEQDPDLLQERYEQRRARRNRCLCGYPDWPGQCPGPDNCPVHGEDLSDG